jgi:hypothetical protein
MSTFGGVIFTALLGAGAAALFEHAIERWRSKREGTVIPMPGNDALGRFLERMVTISRDDVGEIVEESKNSSPRIDAMLAYTGVSPGNNWCAAYVQDVVRRANTDKLDLKIALSAGAKATGNSMVVVTPSQATPQTVPPGSIVFWDRSDPNKPETAWHGHIGIVDSWIDADHVLTNEGNVSPFSGGLGDKFLQTGQEGIPADKDRTAQMVRSLKNPKLLGFGIFTLRSKKS